jgi:antitoxin CptB
MSEAGRLRWKCRRGMKELDELLVHYLQQHYPQAADTMQRAFERLLDMQDPELYALLLGKADTDDQAIADVTDALRRLSHT